MVSTDAVDVQISAEDLHRTPSVLSIQVLQREPHVVYEIVMDLPWIPNQFQSVIKARYSQLLEFHQTVAAVAKASGELALGEFPRRYLWGSDSEPAIEERTTLLRQYFDALLANDGVQTLRPFQSLYTTQAKE